MQRVAITIILLASAVAATSGGPASAATTVYRWVDEQGVVHFSDQPHPGAQKLRVEDAPTFTAPPTAPAQNPAAAGGSAPPAASCVIDSPSNEQTLMNTWSVSGHIRMPQQVARDARVLLMLDGRVLTDVADVSGSFNIAQIDRGAHTLAAQVQTADGQVICETPQITFYVHQPSAQAPNGANRPHS